MSSITFAGVALAQYIDHTLLSATATRQDIQRLCLEAVELGFRAVCLHPYWVSLAHSYLKGSPVDLASVVDFPYGASLTKNRLQIAEQAILDGASELDLVAPLHLIEAEDWDAFYRDLQAICYLAGSRARVKTIIEVSLFTAEQVMQASEIAARAGSHMIKTSTGIINKRATELADIACIKMALQGYPDVQIKASAGIKTTQQALAFLEAGVARIGTSSAIALLHRSAQVNEY